MKKTLRSLQHLHFVCLAAFLAHAGHSPGAGWEGRQPPAPIPPFPIEVESFISVHARPGEIVLGEDVSIYGSLTDLQGNGIPLRRVDIGVRPPGGGTVVLPATTDLRGDYAIFHTPDSAGEGWEVVASWPGDVIHSGAISKPPAFFNVLPATTKIIAVASAYSVLPSETLNVKGRIETTTPIPADSNILGGQTVTLFLLDPLGGTPVQVLVTTDTAGGYEFANVILGKVGVWKLWVRFEGSPNLGPSSSSEMRVHVKSSAGYAIVVSGMGADDANLQRHNRTADSVYRKLLRRGFGAESIFYLRFGVPDDNGILVDGAPSKDAMRYAITTWAKERMTSEPGPLFMIFVGAGKPLTFFVSGETETLAPWELDGWIAALEKALTGTPAAGQPIVFVYGAPYSGSFVHKLSRSGYPRVIITSADPRELPVTGPEENGATQQGEFFVLELFENLAQGRDLTTSFQAAVAATFLYTVNRDGNGVAGGLDYPDLGAHHPQLDDNGDGIGSFGFLSGRAGSDGAVSAEIFLGYGEPLPEAQIIAVSPKQIINPGGSPELWLKASDRDMVQGAWVVIKPPFFGLGTVSPDAFGHRDVDGIRLPLYDADGDGVYWPSASPTFTQTGTYRVLFFVKDKYTGQLGEMRKSKVIVLDAASPGPGDFSLASPQEGETVGRQILLKWNPSPKGRTDDEITYIVQIATDPLFMDVVFEQDDIEGTSLLVGEDAGLLDRKTYFWRVKAESFFGKARFARGSEMKSTDIGQALEGVTTYDSRTDSYTILGDGLGALGTDDQLRLVHTSAGQSFELSARVDSLDGVSSPALVGIMIRQSTDSDSPYAMIGVNAEKMVVSGFRGAPGSEAFMSQHTTMPLPGHLRMVCLRSTTTGLAEIQPFFSPDGNTWHPGEPVSLLLPDEVRVGICVISGDASRLVKAVVGDFTVLPLPDLPIDKSTSYETTLSAPASPPEPLGSEYGTFQTGYGAGLPGYNVLTVLVYNENDPSQSPPGTAITISPIVGTINNWMYSGYVPVGTYTIDVSAPNFSSEGRIAEVTTGPATTEVFTLTPNSGSVSGKVVRASDLSNLRGATVELEVRSGIYLGTIYSTTSGADGSFSVTALPAAVNYRITVSKTYYSDYQVSFALAAGQAKNLGTISLSFPDTDSDGLPDGFEQTIVDFDPGDAIDAITDVIGSDDFDGDGQTNQEEYLAGTSPTASTSYLRVVSIVSNTSNAFTITWTSASGMLYRTYYCSSVGGWSVGKSDIPASGTGQNSWTDDSASGTSPPAGSVRVRFYRVEAY